MISVPRLASSVCAALLGVALLGAADVDPRIKAREELRGLEAQIRALSRAAELVHEIVAPSVLSIKTREQVLSRFSGVRREIDAGEGSGFIVRSSATQAFALTNAHVVLQTSGGEFVRDRRGTPIPYDRLRVVLSDNREVDAEYVAYDILTDLAVIRLPLGGLPAAEWSDSDQAHVGQPVIALGYPLGVGYSASQGIVSATDRSTGIYQAVGGFESFIQTDAAINPGNSGGPLVDLSARILGVNANIVSRSGGSVGVGFAIPANLAKRVASDLIDFRAVRRPAVGVHLDDINADNAQVLGLPRAGAVRITQVIPLTPAATAGLLAGDVVLSVNGQRVQSVHHFRARVAALTVEVPLVLRVWRNAAEQEIRVATISQDELRRRLDEIAARQPKLTLERFGITVTVDERSAISGLRISDIDDTVGDVLRVGDRILRERTLGPLRTLEEAQPLTNRRSITVQVQRGDGTFWLQLSK